MDLTQLASRLHRLNEMERTGQAGETSAESDRLDDELAMYHLRTYWSNNGKEWIICDTLIHERED